MDTTTLAVEYCREQFEKRPDEESLKANAREAFLATFKRFRTAGQDEAHELAAAFIESYGNTTAPWIRRALHRSG